MTEDGRLYTISEVSEITGVPVPTLRYWYRIGTTKGGTKAPSKVKIEGKAKTYLYTEDDLVEIRDRKGPREIRDRTEDAVRSQDN